MEAITKAGEQKSKVTKADLTKSPWMLGKNKLMGQRRIRRPVRKLLHSSIPGRGVPGTWLTTVKMEKSGQSLYLLRQIQPEVYTDTLEVRMWEKGRQENKPMGFDLNHQKTELPGVPVFRREEPIYSSNRDIEWTLRSEVKKGFPGWRYKFGSHHMFEESLLFRCE